MRTTTGSLLLAQKSFDQPDEVRQFEKGSIEIVKVGEHTVGRATFAPGWRWSQHVQPIAGTDLCEVDHLAYVVSGKMKVRMADGTEAEFGPTEIMAIRPGHDAWVLGKEPCVIVDFAGAATYAKG